MGQGFWPGPGKWIGYDDQGWALVAACDVKDCYDWWWPKEITTENPATFERFKYPRWESFQTSRRSNFKKIMPVSTPEKDPRPSVVEHWKGFEAHDPRMWDEDTWPVRLPHNPVQRAFRTVAFVREPHPYLLVVDDIQKDSQERLYEWLMQMGMNTAVARMAGNDIILCDATVPLDENGVPQSAQGRPRIARARAGLRRAGERRMISSPSRRFGWRRSSARTHWCRKRRARPCPARVRSVWTSGWSSQAGQSRRISKFSSGRCAKASHCRRPNGILLKLKSP